MSDGTAGPGPDDVTLLPTISRGSDLHRQLHAALTEARATTPDPALRRVLDDVLTGRTSLRSAFHGPELGGLVARAGEASRAAFDALSPAEQEALRARARGDDGHARG